MNKLDRFTTNLLVAAVISKRADCKRAQVGCVITLNHRIISSGYNGPLLSKDCSAANCNVTEKCKHAVHAEANAIAAASMQGIPLKGSTLYCTHCPCYDCAKLIIQSGIKHVVYMNDYKTNNEGFFLLLEDDSPVELIRYEPTPEFLKLYDQIKNYSN